MAEIKAFRPEVTVRATIKLNESELAALEALACYGANAFLRVFYEKLGRSYMEPHEKALRSIFTEIHRIAPAALQRAEEARAQLKKAEAEITGRVGPAGGVEP